MLEVHLERHILADGLPAYREGQMVFLPLSELSSVLTIAVSAKPELKKADGFIISEDRKFSLDLVNFTATVSGSKVSFKPSLVRIRESEIYVESHLYAEWFPVEISIDIPGLLLKVSPKEQLPIQARLAREKKDRSEGDTSNPTYQNFDMPYEWIDKPFLDQTVEFRATRLKDSQTLTSANYTTLISGDFLGLETHFIASGHDGQALEEYRYTLGRDDPDGNLLGPMHAKTFSVGNVNLPSVNWVVRSTSAGRGGFIGNRPVAKSGRFDAQSFTGDLLPGWDVELFQNGILINHQNSNEKSKYEFIDVPLYFGGNDFRLVFHGPVGQILRNILRTC